MKEIRTEGVVLRYADYRDDARMITLLTPGGRVDAAAYRSRKAHSPLFAPTQLFARGAYILQLRQGGHITMKSAQLLDGFLPIRSDMDRYLHLSYCAALALVFIQPDEELAELYALFLSALSYFAYSDKDAAAIAAYFVLHAMDFAGYRPNVDRCDRCGSPGPFAYFNPASGEIFCAQCLSAENIHPRAVDWMRACLTLTDRPERLLDYPEPAKRALRILLPYCDAQLDTHIKSADLLPYA